MKYIKFFEQMKKKLGVYPRREYELELYFVKK